MPVFVRLLTPPPKHPFPRRLRGQISDRVLTFRKVRDTAALEEELVRLEDTEYHEAKMGVLYAAAGQARDLLVVCPRVAVCLFFSLACASYCSRRTTRRRQAYCLKTRGMLTLVTLVFKRCREFSMWSSRPQLS